MSIRVGRLRGISKYQDSKLDLFGSLVIYEISLLKDQVTVACKHKNSLTGTASFVVSFTQQFYMKASKIIKKKQLQIIPNPKIWTIRLYLLSQR